MCGQMNSTTNIRGDVYRLFYSPDSVTILNRIVKFPECFATVVGNHIKVGTGFTGRHSVLRINGVEFLFATTVICDLTIKARITINMARWINEGVIHFIFLHCCLIDIHPDAWRLERSLSEFMET